MQEWVKQSGAKICIVFEGRDTAGKGGTIKAITERVSPGCSAWSRSPRRPSARSHRCTSSATSRTCRPPGRSSSSTAAGTTGPGSSASWGSAPTSSRRRFLEMVPETEKAMVDSGIMLVKYWLEVGPDEQTRRLEGRIDDPRKTWKLTDTDLKSYVRWDDYSTARDDMFAATDTAWAPWFVANSDDKKRARLNVISHLLDAIPYKPVRGKKVALPDAGSSNPTMARPQPCATSRPGSDPRGHCSSGGTSLGLVLACELDRLVDADERGRDERQADDDEPLAAGEAHGVEQPLEHAELDRGPGEGPAER